MSLRDFNPIVATDSLSLSHFRVAGKKDTVAELLSSGAGILMKYKPNVSITVTKNTPPLPGGFDSSELQKHYDTIYETRLEDAIVVTLEHFEKLEG